MYFLFHYPIQSKYIAKLLEGHLRVSLNFTLIMSKKWGEVDQIKQALIFGKDNMMVTSYISNGIFITHTTLATSMQQFPTNAPDIFLHSGRVDWIAWLLNSVQFQWRFYYALFDDMISFKRTIITLYNNVLMTSRFATALRWNNSIVRGRSVKLLINFPLWTIKRSKTPSSRPQT